MPLESTRYEAWREAESLAAAAESQLFAKLRSATELPHPDQVEEVRMLREKAAALLLQMLEEMRNQAASLRHRNLLHSLDKVSTAATDRAPLLPRTELTDGANDAR